MKPEYKEGPEALRNFEAGMKALFKAPKVEMASLKKKNAKQSRKGVSERKPKNGDKD